MKEFGLDIVCLLEPRISGKEANCIIDKMGFNFSYCVEVVDFSSGIWISWKELIRIEIIQNHPQFILIHIFGILPSHSFFVFFVYGSSDRNK